MMLWAAIVTFLPVWAGSPSTSGWGTSSPSPSGWGSGKSESWKWKPKRWYVQCPELTWDTGKMSADAGCLSQQYLRPGDAAWPDSADADHWCCVQRSGGGPQPCALGSNGQPIDPNCTGFTRATGGSTSEQNGGGNGGGNGGSGSGSNGNGGGGGGGKSWNGGHKLFKFRKVSLQNTGSKSSGGSNSGWNGGGSTGGGNTGSSAGGWSGGQSWKWKPKRWYVQCPELTWDTGKMSADAGCLSQQYLRPGDAAWPDSADADHWCCVQRSGGGPQPCALGSNGQPIDPNCKGFTRATGGSTTGSGSYNSGGGNNNNNGGGSGNNGGTGNGGTGNGGHSWNGGGSSPSGGSTSSGGSPSGGGSGGGKGVGGGGGGR